MKWITNLFLRVEYFVMSIPQLLKETEALEAQLEKKIGIALEQYTIEEQKK